MAIVNRNVTLYRLNPTLTSVWMEKQLRQHSGFEVLALESVLEEVHDTKSWELLQDSTDYRLLFSLSVRVRKQLDGNWQTFFSLVFFSSFPFFFFCKLTGRKPSRLRQEPICVIAIVTKTKPESACGLVFFEVLFGRIWPRMFSSLSLKQFFKTCILFFVFIDFLHCLRKRFCYFFECSWQRFCKNFLVHLGCKNAVVDGF